MAPVVLLQVLFEPRHLLLRGQILRRRFGRRTGNRPGRAGSRRRVAARFPGKRSGWLLLRFHVPTLPLNGAAVTNLGQLQGEPAQAAVLVTGRAQNALVQAEMIDAERSSDQAFVAQPPALDRPARILRASTEGDVGMEGAQVEVQAGRDERIVDPLAQLKEPRMPAADARPEDPRRTLGREDPHPFDRQDERLDPLTQIRAML